MRTITLLLFFGASAHADECVDENAGCANWASSGECDRNPGFMRSACASGRAMARRHPDACGARATMRCKGICTLRPGMQRRSHASSPRLTRVKKEP